VARLIDADALLESVDKERQYLIARGQKGAEHILVHNFRDLIDNAPTVDIQTAVMELYRRYQPRLATNVYEFGVELHELLGRYGGGS
jgi:hypothetical protein